MAQSKKTPAASKALINIDQEFAAAAADGPIEKPSGGSKISTKGGVLSYGGATIPNNELDVIVLEFSAKNTFYAGAYNPDDVSPPDCFAIELAKGKDFEDKLAPHEKVENPVHDACQGCPNNEFKSGDNGRGKACKNRRDLAVIPADVLEQPDVAKAILDSEIAVFSVSPANLKAWRGYTAGLGRASLPVWAVTTRLGLPSVFDQSFQMVEGGDLKPHFTLEVKEAMEKKREEAREILLKPYEPISEEQKQEKKAAPKRGSAPAGRSARFTAPAAPSKAVAAPAKAAPKKR